MYHIFFHTSCSICFLLYIVDPGIKTASDLALRSPHLYLSKVHLAYNWGRCLFKEGFYLGIALPGVCVKYCTHTNFKGMYTSGLRICCSLSFTDFVHILNRVASTQLRLSSILSSNVLSRNQHFIPLKQDT